MLFHTSSTPSTTRGMSSKTVTRRSNRFSSLPRSLHRSIAPCPRPATTGRQQGSTSSRPIDFRPFPCLSLSWCGAIESILNSRWARHGPGVRSGIRSRSRQDRSFVVPVRSTQPAIGHHMVPVLHAPTGPAAGRQTEPCILTESFDRPPQHIFIYRRRRRRRVVDPSCLDINQPAIEPHISLPSHIPRIDRIDRPSCPAINLNYHAQQLWQHP